MLVSNLVFDVGGASSARAADTTVETATARDKTGQVERVHDENMIFSLGLRDQENHDRKKRQRSKWRYETLLIERIVAKIDKKEWIWNKSSSDSSPVIRSPRDETIAVT